jgi:hypothetical protein
MSSAFHRTANLRTTGVNRSVAEPPRAIAKKYLNTRYPYKGKSLAQDVSSLQPENT